MLRIIRDTFWHRRGRTSLSQNRIFQRLTSCEREKPLAAVLRRWFRPATHPLLRFLSGVSLSQLSNPAVLSTKHLPVRNTCVVGWVSIGWKTGSLQGWRLLIPHHSTPPVELKPQQTHAKSWIDSWLSGGIALVGNETMWGAGGMETCGAALGLLGMLLGFSLLGTVLELLPCYHRMGWASGPF